MEGKDRARCRVPRGGAGPSGWMPLTRRLGDLPDKPTGESPIELPWVMRGLEIQPGGRAALGWGRRNGEVWVGVAREGGPRGAPMRWIGPPYFDHTIALTVLEVAEGSLQLGIWA